ncbi:MAG: response regulator [Candidatus Omnitrophica bacterium]|nr:response regulator [Candidatus Omnitrophota bacterium]
MSEEKKYKILIVEDEPDAAKVLHKRVTGAGFGAVIAYDAYAAIKSIREETPDLILLDLMLPAGGGLSILQNLNLFAASKPVPVIVITGIGDDAYRRKVMDMGADAYFEKPYEAEEVISKMKELLGI